jgi:hypothetical protein
MSTPTPVIARWFAALAASMLLWSSAGAAGEPGQAPQTVPRTLTADAHWSIRLPKDEIVAYRGLATFDSAGSKGGGMLYPAAGVIGLLAAVATHGMIVDSQKKAEKERIQAAADQILQPYQPILATFTYRELMRQGLAGMAGASGRKLIEFPEKRGADWVIESAPVFFITQDQRAIILDIGMVVYPPGDTPAPAYQNVIRVVSPPEGDPDIAAFWNSNQGEKLKESSARLFAESLDIVVREIAEGSAKDGMPYKTVRYMEGATEKMERAMVISARCDRLLIKNLRGWLMSIPAKPGTAAAQADEQCAKVPDKGK